MSDEPKAALTQRAYTLRLRGIDPKDDSWRDALWATHEAVNTGAKAFGDWLLTLRGGLDHRLVDEKIAATKSKLERDPTSDERRDRRILLALSWLSVESEDGAPQKEYIVAKGSDGQADRRSKVLGALEATLKVRGIADTEIGQVDAPATGTWMADCAPSLSARIRDDAVWVNRSGNFDQLAQSLHGVTRDHARSMLEAFVGDIAEFLSLPTTEHTTENDDGGPLSGAERDVSLAVKASGWLSRHFGGDEKSDKQAIATNLSKLGRAHFDPLVGKPGNELVAALLAVLGKAGGPALTDNLKAIRQAVGWRPSRASEGRKAIEDLCRAVAISADDIDRLKSKLLSEAKKRHKEAANPVIPWASQLKTHIEDVVGFPYTKDRFTVMLDHAIRRFSSTHSWVRRAELRKRTFENDARKRDALRCQCRDAVDWLDSFCRETGDSYRIRRRALGGRSAAAWQAVVEAWSAEDCRTEEDRISAVRQGQADWDQEEKFGHARLFEQLAGDSALCVWRPNGDAKPEFLIDYVAATNAEFDRTRYKVPMYRHPDPLRHPVFCDFGNSRWSIHFELHKACRANDDAGVRTGRISDLHRLTLQLLMDRRVESLPLRWASKRLDKDLAVKTGPRSSVLTLVTRADRFGRAVTSAFDSVKIMNVFEEDVWNGRLQASRHQLDHIARLNDSDKARCATRRLCWFLTFSPKMQPAGCWLEYANRQGLYSRGRDIQLAPKKEADAWRGLAYPIWHRANEKGRKGWAKHILSRLPGLRVLSVDLGHRFAAACTVWQSLSQEQFDEECRRARDLGWSVTVQDLYASIEQPERETNCATKKARQQGGVRMFKPRTCYRRIGPDQLRDATVHPAPWARLERQFFIKLQGEEEPRQASNDEIGFVHELESMIGVRVPIIDRLVQAGWGREDAKKHPEGGRKQAARLAALKKMGWKAPAEPTPPEKANSTTDNRKPSLSVAELMAEAVRTVRLGLRRHGDRARIAFMMTADHKPMPGRKKLHFDRTKAQTADDEFDRRTTQQDRNAARVEFMTDALELWHALAVAQRWRDETARLLWHEMIESVYGVPLVDQVEGDQPESRSAIKMRREQLRGALREKVAQPLIADDSRQTELYHAWSQRWCEDDAKWQGKTGILRRLHRQILPRGIARIEEHSQPDGSTKKRRLVDKNKRGAARRVGGLSLTRISTLTTLYQLLKAYRMRPEPDNPRKNIPEKGDDALAEFHRRLLETRDRMREQRVKQLASRIAEAALGIGRFRRAQRKKGQTPPKDPKRPERPVDEPCHAVVVENLTNYRPDELQTRRENRQLMDWSSSKVKKYLAEACQLHGLHLRDVSAAYTSRQDSRTGMPGMRCSDVPVSEFLRAPWWRRRVNQARARNSGTRSAGEQFLVDLEEHWQKLPDEERPGKAVRIPNKGGEVFVSAAVPTSKTGQKDAAGFQADLNAAANIGLRALVDPDWAGRWWYVPCNTSDERPVKDKVAGCPILPLHKPLLCAHGRPNARSEKSGVEGGRKAKRPPKVRQSKEIVNYWHDPTSGNTLPESDWQPTQEYWKDVELRVIDRLRRFAGLREAVDTTTPW